MVITLPFYSRCRMPRRKAVSTTLSASFAPPQISASLSAKYRFDLNVSPHLPTFAMASAALAAVVFAVSFPVGKRLGKEFIRYNEL